ncbi:3-deoxy-7-phosphoheptulonate synthase [Streptomyces europaeiscabiei]|uniref:Phospho-2-dehydro-3-deoxyheptonate aldolase n=1 Tax=Streptomyces europaeiscabiei TaxID=146819 RepID=A0ABU4NVK2_9ACTN|nr:3-deoxy-7-phosphoheptulonate synthase [Streptomyces europaeiscabiei]MDX3549607.1 3-deoxy-7-phosphoheptulonate synthase [Streptomyces europaeiscabiei]MDX3558952.1 3-deoxy-7-phosphoheptulonate synthase [Streptomyces europaeiscabiei]MDX3706719.1 3-deoxy-7-phosphoheptulonate synthase [Streptomyces europaeiscabiei]
MDYPLLDLEWKIAPQQPVWDDPAQVSRVRSDLASRPALVRADDVRALRGHLARVAAGEALVVQAGDCAEDPDECTAEHVARKAAVLDLLAGALRLVTGKPVIRVGRIAGQFGKPRSKPTELIGGVELPVYRGHMVNNPEPTPEGRRPDPLRLLTGYMAADEIMHHLNWHRARGTDLIDPAVWTSHEALLLDYEVPLLRHESDGLVLSSTHWPWIGERTRRPEGAHVALLTGVVNPVACKVGPGITPEELLDLCRRLDPRREPGRLTLIARMGADAVADALPPLVEAVRKAGHPVIWLTDPLHGNTVTTPGGFKTRYVEAAEREVVAFHHAVTAGGGIAGGLHLETTPDAVMECVSDARAVGLVGDAYQSLCDPRLNVSQGISVVSAWQS